MEIIASKLAVIGHPIGHSLSPQMHNAALKYLKIPLTYKAIDIPIDQLEEFITQLPESGLLGFNLTIPHKIEILPFLDYMTEETRAIGACNTVVIEKGKLIGHNTDGVGYIRSLKDQINFDVKNKKVIMIGAGGAARAIAYALVDGQISNLIILNRSLANAEKLALDLQSDKVSVGGLKKFEEEHWTNVDLVINTTSMGMKDVPLSPLPYHWIPPHSLLSDIVYNPLQTPFLKEGLKRNLKIHAGWGMLLFQGALAFEIWTGEKAPIKVMEKALLNQLKVGTCS